MYIALAGAQRPERETFPNKSECDIESDVESERLQAKSQMPNVVLHAAPNSFLVEFIYFKWLFVGQTTQFYRGQHFAVVVVVVVAAAAAVIAWFSIHPKNSSSSLSSYKFEAYNCIVSLYP